MHRKGNHKENEKTTHRLGENTDKGLIFKIYQLTQLNIKKNPNPIKKWADLNRHLSKEDKEHEMMFNLTNYQSNTNHNCNEASPHTSQ